jgi:hypothetical protein
MITFNLNFPTYYSYLYIIYMFTINILFMWMWRYNIHYKYISTLSMKYNCNCFILNILWIGPTIVEVMLRILAMRIKLKRVSSNSNAGKLNVKNSIILIQHFIIIVRKHIMVNSLQGHYLIIKYLKVLLRIEADQELKKVK